jgi:hypothetical protein
MRVNWRDNHPDERSFQGVLTVAAKCLQPDRIVHGVEQQPCGVQVVEGVGLVAFFPLGNIFGFGYAVFAEKVGYLGLIVFNGRI